MSDKQRHFFLSGDMKAIAFLLVVLVVSLGAFHFLGDDGSTFPAEQSADSTSSIRAPYRIQSHARQYSYYEPSAAPVLSPFDPNSADSTQLLSLGLKPFQVKNIYKYRARGGVFRSPADFARLYGLTQKQFRELEPYIRISADYRPAAELIKDSSQAPRDTVVYPVKLRENEHIELNSADTLTLRKVPGIGRYYASEIDYLRRQLGGFVSKEQLKEIDNFPEEALEYFNVDATAVKKIKVNRLTLNELKRHPYINFYQARAISDYRRLRGPLTGIDALRLMKEFTSADLQRLEPYLEF